LTEEVGNSQDRPNHRLVGKSSAGAKKKKICESRVAMTNTGQRNYEPNCAAVYVLLAAKEMSQFISVPDVTWG